jgi:hypothetical protein
MEGVTVGYSYISLIAYLSYRIKIRAHICYLQGQDTCEIGIMKIGSLIHLLCVGWRNFFPVVLLCQFFVLARNRFWFYILLMLLEYHTVVVLC